MCGQTLREAYGVIDEDREQGDGAFAVVDVDTLWRDSDGKDFHWKGRACKVYSRVGAEWKMTMHTGLLAY